MSTSVNQPGKGKTYEVIEYLISKLALLGLLSKATAMLRGHGESPKISITITNSTVIIGEGSSSSDKEPPK